ncbi:MAG: DUF1080 domain-containing protein [Bacteroidales bacterium]|nr:DUF1080 domain-containing protein [Bacteroidales bacterium]
MKTKLSTLLLFILIIITGTSFDATGQRSRKSDSASKSVKNKKSTEIKLFNGNDLSNWVFYLKDPAVDPASVFTVQNGVIHITGDPFGYMRTKDAYSDYQLHVEWRYPGELSNSGVFVHAQTPDTIWLKCFECQLKAGNAGDFVCMNGAKMNEMKNNSRVVAKMAASSEKSAGEWNTMEVTCKSNTIEVSVNGTLQNKATGISDSKGHICLQSEGKDIEFRNVYLTRLPQAKSRSRK